MTMINKQSKSINFNLYISNVDQWFEGVVDGGISNCLDYVFYELQKPLKTKTLIFDNIEIKEKIMQAMPALSKQLFDSLEWFKI